MTENNNSNAYLDMEDALMDSDLSKPLKVSVLREELVKLTGDSNQAIVLNQFIYWSERTKTAAKFIREEMLRVKKYTEDNDTSVLSCLESDLKQGWIYKSANELIEDTMLTISKPTMTRVINNLLDKGWIMKRKNPRYRGDNTPQYRVNLLKLQMDLYKLGYSLNGYKLIMNFVGFAELQKLEDKLIEHSYKENRNDVLSHFETMSNQNEMTPNQNETTSNQIETSLNHFETPLLRNDSLSTQNETTLPEITSEDKSEITLQVTDLKKEEENKKENKYQEKHVELLKWIGLDPNYKNLTITLRQLQVDFENVHAILEYFVNNPTKFDKQIVKQQLMHMGERSQQNNGIAEFATYFINGVERRLQSAKINKANESMLDDMLGMDKEEIPQVILHNWLEGE
ncbi:MarR family transcriptional regulator [Enterococcus sp. DIV0086]|uniref:MarR family transcriptional regulator n=1 Tax=Enterococcus sp. DIV0086 TaxID=2774655 RepID=UPI003D2C3733